MSTKISTATDYLDLLQDLDGFLCDQGHAWALAYAGTGNGTLSSYIGKSGSVAETITVAATSSTNFTVTGSVSGSLGSATVGTPFTSSKIDFTITAGGTAFVSGDTFTLSVSPKWTRLRFGGCAESIYRTGSMASASSLFDGTTSSGGVSTTSFPATVDVQMAAATEVLSFAIWSGGSTSQAPAAFSLQYSDNGSSWTTAQSWSSQTWSATYTRRDFVLSAAPGAHLYWRINITSANSSTLAMAEVRLFGDAGGNWDVSSRFEFAWEAPGRDGTKTIYVAGYTYTDNATDTYNLVFRGFRDWLDTSLSVLNVPNNTGDKAHLLSKTSTAYWMVANGDNVKLLTRVSGIYELSYAGFGLAYETPTNHPYPYLLGAPSPTNTLRWDSTNGGVYRNPVDPGSASGVAGLAAYYPDGAFRQVANRASGVGTDGNVGTGSDGFGRTWPYSSDNLGTQVADLRDCLDGTKPLLPVVIFNAQTPQHVWGEFDGLYWTTGFSNSAESLIAYGGLDHLVFTNTFRSGLGHFAAMTLD